MQRKIILVAVLVIAIVTVSTITYSFTTQPKNVLIVEILPQEDDKIFIVIRNPTNREFVEGLKVNVVMGQASTVRYTQGELRSHSFSQVYVRLPEYYGKNWHITITNPYTEERLYDGWHIVNVNTTLTE